MMRKSDRNKKYGANSWIVIECKGNHYTYSYVIKFVFFCVNFTIFTVLFRIGGLSNGRYIPIISSKCAHMVMEINDQPAHIIQMLFELLAKHQSTTQMLFLNKIHIKFKIIFGNDRKLACNLVKAAEKETFAKNIKIFAISGYLLFWGIRYFGVCLSHLHTCTF